MKAVDDSFRKQWSAAKMTPAAPAGDLALMRRLSLALCGTVPSLEEIRRFEARPKDTRVSEWLDTLCAETAREAELSAKALRAAPLAQQRRTLLRWLQGRGVKDVSFADVEAVRGLLEKNIPAKVNLSAGRFARRRAGKIFVE